MDPQTIFSLRFQRAYLYRQFYSRNMINPCEVERASCAQLQRDFVKKQAAPIRVTAPGQCKWQNYSQLLKKHHFDSGRQTNKKQLLGGGTGAAGRGNVCVSWCSFFLNVRLVYNYPKLLNQNTNLAT